MSNLAERLNPRKLGYSPMMAAIVGAVIGHDYGVRDRRGNRLTGLNITSDGFVIASTSPLSSGAFLAGHEEVNQNLSRLLADAKLTAEELAEYRALYAQHVHDWRV